MSSPNNVNLSANAALDDNDDASSTIAEAPTTPRQTKPSHRHPYTYDEDNPRATHHGINASARSTTISPPSTPKPTKASIQEHDIALMAAKQAPKHTNRARLTRDMSARDHASGACHTMRFDNEPFVSDEEFERAYTLTRLHRVYIKPGMELLPNENLEEERRKLGIVIGGPLAEGDGDVFMF